MTAITSSAASDTERARKRTPGRSRHDAGDHRVAAAVRHVDVEQDDVRVELLDQRHGVGDRRRLTDDLDRVAELGRTPERNIGDRRPGRHAASLGGPWQHSSTSVPSPTARDRGDAAVALMRATIESLIPRRSCGTAALSKPMPRSRTNTVHARRSPRHRRRPRRPRILRPVRHRLAGREHDRGDTLVGGAVPGHASSTGTPCSSSTSAAAADSSVNRDSPSPPPLSP